MLYTLTTPPMFLKHKRGEPERSLAHKNLLIRVQDLLDGECGLGATITPTVDAEGNVRLALEVEPEDNQPSVITLLFAIAAVTGGSCTSRPNPDFCPECGWHIFEAGPCPQHAEHHPAD